MQPIARADFTSSLFRLLQETFEGPPPDVGSAYLDKGAALSQTLDQLTAEAASIPPVAGAPTIAAHCEHARFYVVALQDFMRGATAKVDWVQSWPTHAVTQAEWEELKVQLRGAYEALMEHLQSIRAWGDEEVGDAMAILVHTAYHLGAIRQLAKTLAR